MNKKFELPAGEKASLIDKEATGKNLSCYGNTFAYITEADITALRNGRVIFIDDGEYCTFISLRNDLLN